MKEANHNLSDFDNPVNKAWKVFNKYCKRTGQSPDCNKAGYGDLKACWDWLGGLNEDGYGHANAFGGTFKAHRLSYKLHIGEIDTGAQVLHKCDNPKCVNPDHLFIGTPLTNMRDKMIKGRGNHARGARAGSTRLIESQILEIRSLRKQGVKSKKLAEQFGVSQAAICHIVSGRNWSYIPL